MPIPEFPRRLVGRQLKWHRTADAPWGYKDKRIVTEQFADLPCFRALVLNDHGSILTYLHEYRRKSDAVLEAKNWIDT